MTTENLEVTMKRPGTRDELREWVRASTGYELPDKPICRGHDTPLDYLEYAFFERGDIADTVVWACRGGGKTMIGALATLLDLLFKPGIQVKILGGSRDQSLRMYTYLCDIVERQFAGQVAGKIKSTGFALANGSRVEILTQSQRAVRGTRVQKMRCDEVELFDRRVWSAAQLTTRSLLVDADGGPRPLSQQARGAVEVFSTLHLPGGLMAELVDRAACPLDQLPQALEKPTERRIFRWCVWDIVGPCRTEDRACEGCALQTSCQGKARNGTGFMPIEDVFAMQRRASKRAWESEMLCLVPATENPVFDGFDEDAHVRAFPGMDQLPTIDGQGLRRETLIAGIDYGWKRFVCLWIAMLRDAAGRRAVWVADEYVQGQRDLPRHVAEIQTRSAVLGMPRVFYADVAGRQHDTHTALTSETLLKASGLPVKSRAMGIGQGVERIRALLEPPETWGATLVPRFWVDPRCQHLIAALTHYRQKNGEPVKDGVHDHLIDALRYALVGHDSVEGKVEQRKY